MKTQILQKLKEKRLKLTPQRLAIIDVLVEHSSLHPGASLIFQAARKKMKRLSLSTVYATLDKFSKLSIIKILEFDRIENRYEGNIETHINLVCKGCKKIIDYKLPIPIDSKDVAKRAHFVIVDARLEYYGYCEKCRKRRTINK
jgi:Fe2+ or Zn2+ uptake regulation protein